MSRFAARRGYTIATTSIAGPVRAGSARAASVCAASLLAGSVLAGCGGAGPSGGAPPPARPGSATVGGPVSPGPAGGPGTAAATGTSAPTTTTGGPAGGAADPSDDSPAAAGRVVEAYYREINAAARGGRVADVSATALPGCQTCTLDVGMTRRLDQLGLRAAQEPYEITGLAAGERIGTVVDVRFIATTRQVHLLDPAGRDAGTEPAVPTRTATARLALTGPGWRVQTITYAAG
ncbi:hypothetical protein [Parafrankia sp. BMG5.11]|uniref:hypothetical protein n=1 Tax=Parafrankia sp. BMG5.11 TaxID=222540 RepID=UPI001FB42E7C|nr:hypothetical protein [Parafrankia sp. BMG5.11]